jgi:hypothetical protein
MKGTLHVTPAKAGVSCLTGALTIASDPGLRRDDGITQ